MTEEASQKMITVLEAGNVEWAPAGRKFFKRGWRTRMKVDAMAKGFVSLAFMLLFFGVVGYLCFWPYRAEGTVESVTHHNGYNNDGPTVIYFKDGRRLRLTGVSSVPIERDKYYRVYYNGLAFAYKIEEVEK